MSLKKNYQTTITNRQYEEQAKRGKVKYRKEQQRQEEADKEIKEWEKKIVPKQI